MGNADGLDAPQQASRSATALRPRRLLGRDREVREVTESVSSNPVTTLTGPGGVGKTALATTVAAAVAAQFPGGVVVVWLASLRSVELVAAEVAAQAGMPRSGGQSYEDGLTHWWNDQDVLLLLDNCEHVVSAVADLVDGLTARLPRLRVLATSREPLWVDGELSYRIAPLQVVGPQASLEEITASPAVRLFQERAGARARGSLDTAHASRLVGEICRRVDGLPLAIELAAARVAGLDLADISLHMGNLFELLPQAARRADGGQRSLRTTVEWSDALLSEQERVFLHRMAVFAGGFDLAAIQAVCATDGQSAAQIADLTARLVEKSLLMRLGDGGRYQVLETIRQYSLERLGAGELVAVRDRQARFYLDAALRDCASMSAGQERAGIQGLGRIEDNVRVALARLLHTAPQDALQLAAGLTNFWWVQGKLREGIGWLEQALAAAPGAPAELRATALFCEGFLIAHDTDDWLAASKPIDAGIELLSSHTEPPPILGMLHCLRGECDVFNGDAKTAVARTQTGLEIFRPYPGTWGLAFCLWNAAYARLAVGDVDAAIALFSELIEFCSRDGYCVAEMCACNVMGEIWEARADLQQSRMFWERALHLRQELGATRMGHVHGSMQSSLLAIARVAFKQGDVAKASQLLREALPLAEERRDAATAQQIVELLQHASRVEPTMTATLRPEGGVWHIAFNGTSVHVPDFKGLWHLRELLSRPREPVSALSLIGAQSEEPLAVGDAGPILDREALKQYRKRLAKLDEQLEEAEAQHDVARHAKRTAEREALVAELARATGLGGKQRRTGPLPRRRGSTSRAPSGTPSPICRPRCPSWPGTWMSRSSRACRAATNPKETSPGRPELRAGFVPNEPRGYLERTPWMWVKASHPEEERS